MGHLAIDLMSASCNNYKFLNIVSDGYAANNLAAKIMTVVTDLPNNFKI